MGRGARGLEDAEAARAAERAGQRRLLLATMLGGALLVGWLRSQDVVLDGFGTAMFVGTIFVGPVGMWLWLADEQDPVEWCVAVAVLGAAFWSMWGR